MILKRFISPKILQSLQLFLLFLKKAMAAAVSVSVAFVASLVIIKGSFAQPLPPPAFPGAEGFGATSLGGRGGAVIEVTNLNDSGPGSLREAIEATGPRTVVFRTGGTIELESPLIINNPFITIAGHTAPGGGITLKNGTNTNTSLFILTNDVIVRHLRVRPGPGGQPDGIAILHDTAYKVILDHCSISWAVDENLSTWYGPHDITIQWCIINEALRLSTHSDGAHSCGALLGSDGSHNLSLHHNLFVHNDGRNPTIKTSGLVDCVNNVIYNYGHDAGYLFNDYNDLPVNYIKNYVIMGPDSQFDEYELEMYYSKKSNFDYLVYVHGNIGPHRPDDSYDEAAVVSPEDRQYLIENPHTTSPITTTTSQEAYDQVLANAGATTGIDDQGDSIWRRDTVDIRVVNDVRNGTGGIIDDPDEVGGWPVLEAGTPPPDSDHDGMPDEWEVQNGLDPFDPTDSSTDPDGDGYTNLETCLSAISLPNNQPPTVDAGPDQTITLTDSVDLDGTVSDDGLPAPPGELTTSWRQISGPGTVTIADINAVTTTASFSEPGSYVFRLTADDAQLATSDEVTVLVTGTQGELVTEFRVAASSDDAEEAPSGSVSLTSSDLELVYDGADQTVGMRFNSVDIPQGATIQSAYLQFQVDEASTEETSLFIEGEASDNAAQFTTDDGNISSRPITVQTVPWSPAPWPVAEEAGPEQCTSDIASVIQEIVDRPGWTAGNSLAIFVSGTGERVAESYDGDPGGAPLLHVVYIPDNEAPTVTAFDLPATSESLTVPILTFTATDNFGVTGYLTTEPSTAPAAEDTGWSATPPTEHTFAAEGDQILYGWAKDAAGNVSSALSDAVTITLNDTEAPTVTAFELPETATILTVPILTFTATDDTGVTGYQATENVSTPPPYDLGWQATPPTSHTFSSDGSQTLYGWAKDAAGNVSTSLSDTVIIDTEAPMVTDFSMEDSPSSLTVSIETFTATDNLGVTGYLATESATAPSAGDAGWSTSPPASYTFAEPGSHTLYGWAKDAAGNVSASLSDTVVITLPDSEAPTVTAFDLPDTSDSLTVGIESFTATDNVGVTGFLATESVTAPSAGDAGWTTSAPTAHTFSAEGSQTLYGWAKDAAGNVSASNSDTVIITLPDTETPNVTAFDLPETATSLTVPITTFTANDNVAVTGYLATESATVPSAGDVNWSASAPTEHSFSTEGSHTLYGWAKDAAGNVSTSLSDTVVITLPDTEAPTVTAFDLPDTSDSLTVDIESFTATDNVGVTGYLATELATAPSAGDAGWTTSPPTSYTFAEPGSKTIYGWAKDAAGNVSASNSDTVIITLPDTEAPNVTAFDLPDTATSLTVPIETFTATDNIAVTGYLATESATESATAPSAGDAGWTTSPPASYTFAEPSSQTLYGWAKDAAGNVSASLSDTVVITLPDTEAPDVTAFDLPDTATSLTVPIETFTATDNIAVTGYLATESATAPSAGDSGWSASSPASYTFAEPGSHTLYGWAKDSAGNVSASLSDTVVITLPDTEAPTVTAFELPDTSNSLTVDIESFTATDNVGVTGYLATESVTAPSAGDAGWSASATTEHTFSAEGSQTLYGWAKDAAGNVSTAMSDTVVITLPDTEAPTVTAFDLPDTSTSLTVPITAFTATDNVAVTGYLATESATPPSAGDSGWSTSAPTEHTFSAEGSQTLYGWAKDAAGNVSTAMSDTVVITLPDTEPPTITAFDLPDTATSLTVPITTFTANDNVAVTGYLATESTTAPSAGDAGWSTSAPASYTFAEPGSHTLYGWAKDAAGNVSTSLSDTVIMTIDNTIHLGDLDGSVKVRGKSANWAAYVTVTAHDQNHSPVANTAISGTWSGATNGTVSGTTDSSGTVTLETGNFSEGNTVVFTVTDVTISGYIYDSSRNHDPDGDSDGTSIEVSR